MTMEQLHFMVESPANFVRLACTILFEKREAMAEWAATWHDVFDCANGEQLFLQFMEELFPDGCTIGEKELNRITDRAVRYLQTETRCLDLKAGHDKSRFTYWVSFIPEHKVYSFGCILQSDLPAVKMSHIIHAAKVSQYSSISNYIAQFRPPKSKLRFFHSSINFFTGGFLQCLYLIVAFSA